MVSAQSAGALAVRCSSVLLYERQCRSEWVKLCANKTLFVETDSGPITSHGLPSPELAKRELEAGGHVAGTILDKKWDMQ